MILSREAAQEYSRRRKPWPQVEKIIKPRRDASNRALQEFELPALSQKVNNWLRGKGLAEFALTPPKG
jgi:hypothetical protein